MRAMRTTVERILRHIAAPGGVGALLRLFAPTAASSTGRVLDVGCGPESWLWRWGLEPVGVDVSQRAVSAFRRHGVGLAVVGSASALPFRDASFDSVWSIGLLHHLPDADVRAAVREMQRVRKVGGDLVIFDAVLPRSAARRPLAWLIRRADRGRWVRREATLTALIDAAGPWHCVRVTYAWTGLEGLLCRTGGEDPRRA
jgi:SAM-dependent methyltransferase